MIISREYEQEALHDLLTKEEPQFCAVYGRRRVGKTYLIRETFNYKFCFQHTGLAKGTLREQLESFKNSLKSYGLTTCTCPKSWLEAFEMLKEVVKRAPEGKKVIFIDELPYMDTPKSKMITALESFWNGWATARPEKDIVLIVCGSSTSWITKKLVRNRKGLRGRLTKKLKINPFTLAECEKYAKMADLKMTRKDILETYMILGGIPYYWSFLQRGYSVAQNIDKLFFSINADLDDEFDVLYGTLSKRPEKYLEVIQALSKKKCGLTRDEILKSTKLTDGGSFTKILKALVESGFIRHYVSYKTPKKGGLYQLVDNYTLFYYHCIKKNAFSDENYWLHTYLSNEHNVWSGLAFERVCLQHTTQMKEALGISGILVNVCSWQTESNVNHPGAQIDLLFTRADNVINVFEMKYAKDKYTINAKFAEDLQTKISTFETVTNSKCAIHPVIVTTYGVTHNEYWNILQCELTMDDLFR